MYTEPTIRVTRFTKPSVSAQFGGLVTLFVCTNVENFLYDKYYLIIFWNILYYCSMKHERVSVLVSKDIISKVKKLAKGDYRNLSDVVRILLDKYAQGEIVIKTEVSELVLYHLQLFVVASKVVFNYLYKLLYAPHDSTAPPLIVAIC